MVEKSLVMGLKYLSSDSQTRLSESYYEKKTIILLSRERAFLIDKRAGTKGRGCNEYCLSWKK